MYHAQPKIYDMVMPETLIQLPLQALCLFRQVIRSSAIPVAVTIASHFYHQPTILQAHPSSCYSSLTKWLKGIKISSDMLSYKNVIFLALKCLQSGC